MYTRGFTLVEMLLVVTLMFIVGAVAFPSGRVFFNMQQLDDAALNIEDALKKAYLYSVTQKNDASYGMYIGEGEVTLYEGSSYAARNVVQDIAFAIPPTVVVIGPTEVQFEERTGVPSATGTILLQVDGAERQITVHDTGLVE